MPLYSYRCRECGHKFETLRRMFDRDKDVECPQCGKKDSEKLIQPFSGYSPRSNGGGFRIG